ncbi:MAG: enoyl-CoA hydratase-related protein [Oscillospiraceae bacterium]|nr:enoyl-CoA hydratase-related protein [Oscillospiraceae bacterium]
MGLLLYEEIGHVGILTVNRPEALNALNSAVIDELSAKIDAIALSKIRCLIVTGSGERSFVAGADISEMKDMTREEAENFSAAGNAAMEKIERLPMPVIAAVNGFALGGGLELALACDIIISSENAVFGLPEVGLGIPPGYGGVQRLARIIGIAKAKELAFTTDRIKAPEALALGLVSAVYPIEELMDAAMRMAEKISANSPMGVWAAKVVANSSVGMPLTKAAGLETPLFGECFGTTDQKQAMTAFVEKRKPEPFAGK